jgi:HK97 family phage portal protein
VETTAQREERIARLAESRALRDRGESRSVTRETVPEIFLPPTTAGPIITTNNVMSLPAAWACVRALVDAVSSLPLHVYRESSSGRARAGSDTLAVKLLTAPAPAVTQPAFLGHLMTSMALHGEAFVGKFRDVDGRVAQLGMFNPQHVEIDVVGGFPMYTVSLSDPEPRTVVLTTADVVHVRGPLTLDGVRGASPVKVARESFGYAAALGEHGRAVFANGAKLGGVMSVADAGPQADDMLKNLQTGFEARHRGSQNAGRIAFVTGEVKWQQVTMSLEDAQWLESCRFSDAQVAQIFRVPPWVIGAPTGGDALTYTTVAEQLRAFVMFSLRPTLVSIEQAIGGDRELFPGGLYPQFEIDALLRADPKSRAEVYTAALNSETGWMTRAEVRALEDLAEEDDGA